MDRRVRKTKEALYSAFVSLIVERHYDAISVQDIIDAADVGRTTFYAHFKSKEELLSFGFDRLREELGSLLRDAKSDGGWVFVEPLLRHAKSHAGLYRALLDGAGGRLAEKEFQSIVEELVAEELGRKGEAPLVIAMLSGALIGGVRTWIDARPGEHPADVAALVRRLANALSPENRQDGP